MEKTEQATHIYERMALLCSRTEYCSNDIRKKIATMDIGDEDVEQIINKLREEKFIDDRRFVKAYANDKFKLNKWGRIKIRYNLKMKGLPDEIISEELNNLDEEQYKKVLIKIMKDKSRTSNVKNRFDKMIKIIRYAQNRGFEPELIHRYMNDVLG